jgi:2,3-dihydroxy-p-cumate/2,3-dihydroxybenzoate 3,4-dioxygenase
MALVHEFGYVAYGVRDLEASVGFLRRVCQLEVSEHSGEVVFLTGDRRHHWVRLEERPIPGLIRVGYKATSQRAVAEIAARLDGLGVSHRSQNDFATDRVRGGVQFVSPHGFEVDVYEEMLELPVSPAPAVGLTCLLHAVVFVSDVDLAHEFFAQTLDLRRSDQIEDLVVFLRGGNRYHHALGLAKGPDTGRLDHIAVLVDDLDTVMRFRSHARNHDVVVGEPVRHAASNSVSIYVSHPEEQLGIEFCAEHDIVEDDNYTGRLLKAGPGTVNMWSVGFGKPPASPTSEQGGGTAAAAVAMRADKASV